jgi:hypothetical protein
LSTNQCSLDIFVYTRIGSSFKTYGVRQDPLPENSAGTRRNPEDRFHCQTGRLRTWLTPPAAPQGIGAEQFYYFRADSEKGHARHACRANGLSLMGTWKLAVRLA